MKNNKIIFLKRIIDVMVSGIGLIILFFIFVIIGILIKLDSKGSVFFIQKRTGKDGKIFRACKLMTMIQGADKKTEGIFIKRDNLYITRIGNFLMRSGIDELTQLINLLKGKVSLVDSNLLYHFKLKNILIFEKNYY